MQLVDSLWQDAQRALARDDDRAAIAALEALVKLTPAFTPAHLTLGGIAHAQGRLRDATRHALDAARKLPDDANMIGNVVNALLMVGEVVAARACLAHPAIARCRVGGVLARLAGMQQMLGEHPAALALLERARAAGLDDADLSYLRGVQLTFNGRIDDAIVELERCLRLGPTYGRASVTLARLSKQTAERNHLDYIRAQLRRVARGGEDHAAFEFAQYKELEDLGEYDAAWQALERGNAIMYARLGHDIAREQARIDALIARSSAEFVNQPGAIPHEGPQPIFIVGMPRSGTTLLDRILGNHSQVASAGELGDFARQLRWAADHVSVQPVDEAILDRAARLDYAEIGRRYLAQTQWRARGKAWFVDKLPINYVQAGFIARALPQARILHMTRAPLDVCFSNWRAFFGAGYAYSYALDALAAQYSDYRRVMAHWHAIMPGRILDVSYEALTGDPARVAHEVFDFCGLPFEPGALDISRNTAPVATLSAMQVRGAIRRREVAEWAPYAARLGSLAAAVETPPG
ncbi:sulfotransferase [Rudaea sp.]|uniref:tetratricopeptide repeat-containing sulfotransferase family protein n=1 Tax=Rudaea sp. TaxID=2136325 RepID=UPI00321FF3C8